MKKNNSVFIFALAIMLIIPNVYAKNYSVNDNANQKSIVNFNTSYSSVSSLTPEHESYDIDLSWDDLYFKFVYHDTVLYSLFNKQLDRAFVIIKNNSLFGVDITGIVKENDLSSKLQIANCYDNCDIKNLTYENQVSISNLMTDKTTKLVLRPKAHSIKSIVLGELKLKFTKSK